MAVRGCEIEGMLDSRGKLIDERPDEPVVFSGNQRTYRVWLDPNQYQKDLVGSVVSLFFSFV